MKKFLLATITLAAILGASVSIAGSGQKAEDPGVLLRAAIEKEEVDGDLQGAIALYREIVAKYSDRSAVAAKAQLRIGMCYEKLGNAEAIKAYEAVLSRFPKEAEAVAEARSRLAALRKEEPAGLTMTKLLPADVYMMCPELSPDGTKMAGIVFDMPEAEGENVAVYDLETGKMRLITDYTYSDESRWSYIPIWSPDGREIAFKAGVRKESIQELWISDLSGKSRLIFKNSNGGIVPCDWLPDGSAVVVILEMENNTARLGLVSVKDGGVREICPLLRTYSQYAPIFGANGSFADASPDGRLIAFSDGPPDGQLDIFIISVDGRSKSPLVDHPGDDRQPRWSPDGRHVVFLSDRHGNRALWGVAVRDGKTDGAPFMVLEGMQDSELACWTKTGLLSRTEVHMNEIYIQEIDPQSHVALGKPRVVEHAPGEAFVGPKWSPDGKHLVFNSYNQEGKFESFRILPSDGGKAKRYEYRTIKDIHFKGGYATWLPDSSGLGGVRWDKENKLFFDRINIDTGEWTVRPVPSGQNFSEFFLIVWSRDGKSFFAFKKGEDGAEPGLVEHDLETGEERYLFRAKPGDEYGSTLKISSDYKRLALHEGGVIVLVDTETGQIERLELGEKKHLFSPSWSPDGKNLVAKGIPDGSTDFNELYIVSLPDGKFKSLDVSRYLPGKESRILTSPDWSPDGRKIAFELWTWRPEANLIRNVIPKK
jgi:Tol biopolymer transport system component